MSKKKEMYMSELMQPVSSLNNRVKPSDNSISKVQAKLKDQTRYMDDRDSGEMPMSYLVSQANNYLSKPLPSHFLPCKQVNLNSFYTEVSTDAGKTRWSSCRLSKNVQSNTISI
jgi:hypothetical protein